MKIVKTYNSKGQIEKVELKLERDVLIKFQVIEKDTEPV